jgi:hypothetical protein
MTLKSLIALLFSESCQATKIYRVTYIRLDKIKFKSQKKLLSLAFVTVVLFLLIRDSQQCLIVKLIYDNEIHSNEVLHALLHVDIRVLFRPNFVA